MARRLRRWAVTAVEPGDLGAAEVLYAQGVFIAPGLVSAHSQLFASHSRGLAAAPTRTSRLLADRGQFLLDDDQQFRQSKPDRPPDK